MSPVLALFIGLLTALASTVAILDWCGIKPRDIRTGLTMSLSTRWKLVLMIGLVALSLGLSGFGFYRSLRPRIVERIVDRPVDRIVEKVVPQECPQPKQAKGSRQVPGVVIPPGTKIEATTNAPGSVATGVNTGTIIQGDAPPQITLAKLGENVPENGQFRTRFRLSVVTRRAFLLYLKATSPSLDGGIGWERDRLDPSQGGYPSSATNVFNGPGYAEEDVENVVAATYTVTLYTSKPDVVNLEYKAH